MVPDPIVIAASTACGFPYLVAAVLFWALCSILYNLLFHHLARQYPGPVLAQASVLYQVYHELKGQLPQTLTELHRKYGPIVRIAPSELSFNESSAWQDIYGRGKHGAYNSLVKDPTFYGPGANGVPSILMCNDEDHQRFRKLMNHAFTSRTVMSQQSLLKSFVDRLISGLHEKSQNGRAVNMTIWYDSFGLDVISDLTYGQPFNCLAAKGSPTPQTEIIASSLKASTWYRAIRRMPNPVQKIIHALLPKDVIRKRQMRIKYSAQKIHERMQRDVERPDVYYFISGSVDKNKMSADEMVSSLSILMAAGSETTATTLAGCTYLLLRNPAVFQRLQQEIVQNFQTEEEITLNKLTSLRFLSAVIDESLRLYPPTPSTLPRRVPQQGAVISGKHIPGGTMVGANHWVVHRSSRHFTNAGDFVPERWLGDQAFSADDKAAFKPFMTGPRNCVGQKLADAEFRLVLSRLVWNFNMELADPNEDWIAKHQVFTLWHKPELKVKLTPRKAS